MIEKPRILILCGGAEAVPGIKKAKKLGFSPIVVDGNKNAPGRSKAYKFIKASIYDPKAVIRALVPIWEKLKIKGIVTIAADNASCVAAVADHFGCKAQSIKTASFSSNKLLMKKILKKEKISTSKFWRIRSVNQLRNIIRKRFGKYVLKPIDSRGARGVVRINCLSEIKKAFIEAKKNTKKSSVILEEWLEGDQLSSESLVWKNKSRVCGLADRNYSNLKELYPFVIEDGGETPSRHSTKNNINKINKIMNKICRAIGLKEGSIKGDLVFSKGKFKVIEFTTRLSGGSFSTITIPLVYNYDLVGNVFRIALGFRPDLPPSPLRHLCYQANRFLFLKKGKVRIIKKNKKFSNQIIESAFNLRVGDRVGYVKNHTMRNGWALAKGSCREDAIASAKAQVLQMCAQVLVS